MKQLVYESLNVDAFESGWDKFLTDNGLQENEWLLTLYEDRHRWVPCYLKNNFWAGMSTTQRSEGMNAFFDGFINSTTTLQQFVVQYDNAIRQKAEKECEADFASLNTTIPCGSHSTIERQFQAEYTHAKFAEVQHKFRCKMNCMIKNVYVEAGTSNYRVMEEFMWKGQCADKYHDVLFHHHTLDIQCTCLLFEFRGILCRHCLVMYAQEGVKSVPDKYVLKRWSKLQRRRHTYIRVGSNSHKEEANVKRYDALCKRFYEIAEVACESDNGTHCLFMKLDSIANDHGLSSSDNPNKGVQLDTANDCPIQTVSSNECVHSPISVKRKGRPRSTRLKSIVEKLGKRRKGTGAKIKGQQPQMVCAINEIQLMNLG